MLLASQKFLFSTSYEYWLLSFENEVALSTPLNPAIASIDETSQRIFFGWTRDGVNNYPILTELNWNGRLLDSVSVTRDGDTNTHLFDLQFEPVSEYLGVALLGINTAPYSHHVVGYNCSSVGAITYSWAKNLTVLDDVYESYSETDFGFTLGIDNNNDFIVTATFGTSLSSTRVHHVDLDASTGTFINQQRLLYSTSSANSHNGERQSYNSSYDIIPWSAFSDEYYQRISFLVKSTGYVSNSRTLGYGDYLALGAMKHFPSSGYTYLSGNVVDGIYYNIVLSKYNFSPSTPSATKVWEKKISNTANTSRFQPRIVIDSNENIYVVWTSPTSLDTIFIHKYGSDGTAIWKRKLAHSSNTLKGNNLKIVGTNDDLFLSFVSIGATTIPHLLKFTNDGKVFTTAGFSLTEDTSSSIATSAYLTSDTSITTSSGGTNYTGEYVTSVDVSVSNPRLTYYK